MRNRILSFKYALQGLKSVLRTEMNMRLHLISALLVLVAAYFFKFDYLEFGLIFLCIGVVWTAEILNTVIEKYLDFYHPERNPKVGILKDMSAAAVLVASLFSLAVGVCLFLPKISAWL